MRCHQGGMFPHISVNVLLLSREAVNRELYSEAYFTSSPQGTEHAIRLNVHI